MTQRKPAFTLLELLTVIAILGLLVAILIPSLQSARKASKAALCLTHLKAMGTTTTIYLNDNDDNFMPVQLHTLSPSSNELYVNGFGRRAPRWQWFLETDLGPVIDPKPFQRSARRRAKFFFDDESPTGGGKSPADMAHDLYTCPTLDDPAISHSIRDGAYGYNYQYLGNTRRDTDFKRWDNFSVGLHQIRSAGATVLFADSRGAGKRHGRSSFTLDPPRLGTEVRATRFGPNNMQYDGSLTSGDLAPGLAPEIYAYSPMEPRHSGRGNVVFVDSHAESRTLEDLGYEVSASSSGLPENTAIPALDTLSRNHGATNKLWNGAGFDDLGGTKRSGG